MNHTRHPDPTRCITTLVVCSLLCACTNWSPHATDGGMRAVTAGCDNTTITPADNARLSSIEQLMSDNKPYAALAQLDALGSQVPQALIIKADALRRIDRDALAKDIYDSLLGGCMAGRAHHGLGLIAAQSDRQALSLTHLQRARELLPTDVRIRNDLGYAYMLAGNWPAAQFELLTVLDLNANDTLASRNLVLLLFRQNLDGKGTELAQRMGMDAATIDRLRQQAATLRDAAQPERSESLEAPDAISARPQLLTPVPAAAASAASATLTQ